MANDNRYYWSKFGSLHDNQEPLVSPVGRAAFVYLTQPNSRFVRPGSDDKPSYGLTVLFPKDDEEVKAGLKLIQDRCVELFEEYCRVGYAKTPKKVKYEAFKASIREGMAAQPIFRDGDTASYNGFENTWTMKLSNVNIDDIKFYKGQGASDFEAGMRVRAVITPSLSGKGFSYKLRALKLVEDDGVRFVSAPDVVSLLSGLDEAVDAVKSKADNGNESDYDTIFEGKPSKAAQNPLDVL